MLFVFCGPDVALYAQSSDDLNGGMPMDTSLNPLPADSIRQVDLIDYLAKLFKVKETDQKRNEKKVNFSLFPSAASKTSSKTVVTSFNATFRLGEAANTTLSSIFFVPYVSFNGQYGLLLQPNVWLRKNSWNLTGEYFILSYPQETWGTGGNSPEENETLIDYNHIRIHQNTLKGIFPHVAVGVGYAFDYHYQISVEDTEFGEKVKMYLPGDKDYTVSSGPTLSVLWDTRHNTINPTHGWMSSCTYSFFSSFLGSTSTYQTLFLDARKYFSIPGPVRDVIAFRGYYWTVLSGRAPYLDLPATRWEPAAGSASRGILQSRYRSNAILYFEAEYRFGITPNGFLGGVVFSNLTSASEFDTQQFVYWHPSVGLGIRMKFNKYSRTNVALDLGFSKESQLVYLNIGEAF